MEIINQLQAGFDLIRQLLINLKWQEFIQSLPSAMIQDHDINQSLPMRTAAVYFLTHEVDGLLYIGKAKNIRSRWAVNMFAEHDCLEPAIQREDVKLSWWVMPVELLIVVEQILIDEWKPQWNGCTGKSRYKEERDDPDPENSRLKAVMQVKWPPLNTL